MAIVKVKFIMSLIDYHKYFIIFDKTLVLFALVLTAPSMAVFPTPFLDNFRNKAVV